MEYSGSLDNEQMIKAWAATLEHPDYRPGKVELTDVSGVTEMALDSKSMISLRSRMVTHYGGQSEHTRHYVVASTDLSFGMTRIYQTLSEVDVPNMTLHLYRSEREVLLAMGREEESNAELLRG